MLALATLAGQCAPFPPFPPDRSLWLWRPACAHQLVTCIYVQARSTGVLQVALICLLVFGPALQLACEERNASPG